MNNMLTSENLLVYLGRLDAEINTLTNLTGLSLEQLIDRFASGYTLESPTPAHSLSDIAKELDS